MNTDEVTRFEIIDHSPCPDCDGDGMVSGMMSLDGEDKVICQTCSGKGCIGREVIFWDEDKQVNVELQDDGKTLKVFIHQRYADGD